MDPVAERIMLRERPWCELPNENGKPSCVRPTAMFLTLKGQYTIAVCSECAAYVQKEANNKILARWITKLGR